MIYCYWNAVRYKIYLISATYLKISINYLKINNPLLYKFIIFMRYIYLSGSAIKFKKKIKSLLSFVLSRNEHWENVLEDLASEGSGLPREHHLTEIAALFIEIPTKPYIIKSSYEDRESKILSWVSFL